MAAYDTLRSAIDSYIKANGNKEITGTVLNDILNAMVSDLGADTRFAGVAVPTTNPGNPEGNVVYFASQAGTYSNFGGIVLPLGIHILVRNGTAWTSQTWFSVDNTPTQNSQNLATSGGILQAIVDAVGVERLRAIGVEVTSASFDSTTKKISFFNSANSTLFQLDATAFVIDGMVSDVKIEDGNLVIQFNTDAGKQDIEIPLTDIFNPANYYTKTVIDELLTVINNKLADGCLYRGMAEPTTNPPTPTTKVFYIATKAGTYTNFGNIAVTEGITILKYDGINWSKEQISYSDGVFDISAYNGTSYADLSAALGTNGANIPENLRKGGMSVKFVLSSDNKNVQFRCITDEFTTEVSAWQSENVDDEPTEGSQNLIKSGAVFPIKEKTDLIKILSTYFGITDQNGYACLYIKDGILHIYGLQIGADLIKKGVKGLIITDKNGNATFILKDGVLTIPELQVGNTDTPINADISKFLHPYNCDGGLFQNILCIGDSLTEGDYGSYPAGTINIHKENYPFYLSKRTGAEVDNKGKSGATTMSYWTDELSKIDTTKDYDAIYLFLGTNNYLFSNGLAQDLAVVAPGTDWRNYDTTTGAGAYCAIISWCIETFPSAKLFIINLPYNNIQPTITQSANYSIQLIADKFEIPVLDLMDESPFRTDNGKIYRPVGYDEEVVAQGYSNGNLHFGKLGYYTLASCINYLTAKVINNKQENYSL